MAHSRDKRRNGRRPDRRGGGRRLSSALAAPVLLGDWHPYGLETVLRRSGRRTDRLAWRQWTAVETDTCGGGGGRTGRCPLPLRIAVQRPIRRRWRFTAPRGFTGESKRDAEGLRASYPAKWTRTVRRSGDRGPGRGRRRSVGGRRSSAGARRRACVVAFRCEPSTSAI